MDGRAPNSDYNDHWRLELTPVNEARRAACDRRCLFGDRRTPQPRRRKSLPVWRLIPTSLADPNWEASSHRAAAVVRAPNEAAARRAAASAFDVATRFPPGGGARFPPWTNPGLVRALRIDEPRYDSEGPIEVLDPWF
jgi:hypothetical protein